MYTDLASILLYTPKLGAYIYLNKVIDISEITDIKRILEETGEQMRDVIFDVAKEASYEQIEDLFNQFIDVFGQYVDASGIMAVS